MRTTIEVVSEPAYEPVSSAEAKRWLRIDADDTDHDLVVDMLIKAMREDAENRTQRAFISRQLLLYLSDWPWHRQYGVKIDLQHPPLISVDSFQYIDTDGVLQTLAADQYVVHDEYEPAFIIPEWEVTWPTIRRVPDAIQITFTAGYAPGSPSDEAANQENMPGTLRLWMESKIAAHNEFREQLLAGAAVTEIPRDFTDGLLDSLIIGSRLF
jgi:uncharacterized phiE125 gp8 family phage protein